MVTVREMTRSDLDAVGRLAEGLVSLHHAWDENRFFTVPDVAGGYRYWFNTQLGKEDVLLLVAEDGGAILGYLYGTMEERDWAMLLDAHGAVHDVFVSADARKRGVAQALMNAAKERFQQRGLERVVLYTSVNNKEGRALFEKLGYRSTMVEMTLDLAPTKASR
jgi:ribosomal protein S18 acetylase RimI-like enzyme